LAFQDITIPLLQQFKSYVVSVLKQSERSAVNHLVVIRSVFSYAIAANVVDEKCYPFGKGKIAIKFPDSTKIGLNEEDIEALEKVDFVGKAHHARNLWLFSYYFAGMRVSDVLRLNWMDFQNNRLYYTMGKNRKGGSLKIPEKAVAILEQYKPLKMGDDDLVFPELKGVDLQNRFVMERTIAFKTSAIDKILKNEVAKAAGINKKLTMHISRHTFAQLAGEDVDIRMLQKLYRHTNISTTIGYQSNFIHKEADEALDRILNRRRAIIKTVK
jgi:site-specific recombinase XerD